MQLQCEHPAIILNPHLFDLVLKHSTYYIRGKKYSCGATWYDEFPYSYFGKIKRGLDIDELDTCYVIDECGEHQPLFLAVPCGKCVLCTEKKANEWVSRAMAESQTSSSIPIFFTLTYNDFCCPRNGVRKGAMQRFMKRLRVNVDRYCGFKSKIRYFICSEYGSKTGRPHYHGILWNFPLLELSHIDDLIDKSWSFSCSKKFYDSVPSQRDKYGKPVLKFVDEKTGRYRIKYGYTTSSICTDGRVRYCMKYMRKDAVIPDGKNKIFFLSSRRGGIGSSWIESKLQEYRSNPQLLDVSLTDIWSGTAYKGILPRFFKDKIAPPPSKIISKDIRDTFKLWNYYSNKFHTFISYHYVPNPRVIQHYPSLHYHSGRIRGVVNLYKKEYNNDTYDNLTRDTAKIVDYLEWKLLNYNYDIGLSVSTPIYKRERLHYIEHVMQSLPPVDIPDKVASIQRRRQRAKLREVL